jgi:hypothetical protein
MTSPDEFWRLAYRDAYRATTTREALLAIRFRISLTDHYADDLTADRLAAGELLTLERLTRFAYHYWCQA